MSRNIIAKLNLIQSKIKDKIINESDILEIKNVDITLTKRMLYSENTLAKGLYNSSWSEEIQNRIIHFLYWRLVIS